MRPGQVIATLASGAVAAVTPGKYGHHLRWTMARPFTRSFDVTAAVTYLQHQPDVDANRIGVLGLSMGGEQAIGAAAADPATPGRKPVWAAEL